MLTYIKLKNYKSFENIEFNLNKTKDKTRNLALIYGENGAGKSNIISAVYSIIESFNTIVSVKQLETLNMKFDELKAIDNDFILKELKRRFRTMESIISECKMIDSEENMIIELGFELKNGKGIYKLETNDKEIINEKLEYKLVKNKGIYFDISKEKKFLNKNLIKDENYRIEIDNLIEQYWGKHTLMAILRNEIREKNSDFLEKSLSKNFMKAFIWLHSINCRVKNGIIGEFGCSSYANDILNDLEEGRVELDKEVIIKKSEFLINEIFTKLYVDIKKVYYEKKIEDKKIYYKLYLNKIIGNAVRRIAFSQESTGTQKILELIPYFINAINGETVLIDEFDSGIHDIMVTDILRNVSEYLNGQLIVTTHNTRLMEVEDFRDSLYFIDVEIDGSKMIKSLREYKDRTRIKNNPRNKYLEGDYGAVPFCSEIDFEYMMERIKE